MSKELIERLRIFVADPVLGGVIEEATDRIEQLETELKTERCLSFRNQVAELEAERDKLREQVKMLRETLDGIRIANWREWDDGVRSADHFVDWAKSRAEFTLAATEPK